MQDFGAGGQAILLAKTTSDTIKYVKTCPTCQMMKSENRSKAMLLQPLEIPSSKWTYVTMDLVTDLPESNGFTAIIVFIDKLTKNGAPR